MTNAERIEAAKTTAEGWEFDMAVEATEQIVGGIVAATGEVVETGSARYDQILIEELEVLGLA